MAIIKEYIKEAKYCVVLQATPFAERGRVWSRCSYRVVTEEHNCQLLRLGDKMVTSAKHIVT